MKKSKLEISNISPNLKGKAPAKPAMKKHKGVEYSDVGHPKGMKSPHVVAPHQNVSFASKKNPKVVDPMHKAGDMMKMRDLASEHGVSVKRSKLSLHVPGPDQGPEQSTGKAKPQHPRKLNGG